MRGKTAGEIIRVRVSAVCRDLTDAVATVDDVFSCLFETVYFKIIHRRETGDGFKFAAQVSGSVSELLAQVSGVDILCEILFYVCCDLSDDINPLFSNDRQYAMLHDHIQQLIHHRDGCERVLINMVAQRINTTDDIRVIGHVLQENVPLVQQREHLSTDLGTVIKIPYIKYQHVITYSAFTREALVRYSWGNDHHLTGGHGIDVSTDINDHIAFLYAQYFDAFVPMGADAQLVRRQ